MAAPIFRRVDDEVTLTDVLSSPATAVLLLHDPWCPISEGAWGEAERSNAEMIWWFDVSERPDLSRLVESHTHVRHESPQLFVLRQGEVAWAGSHSRIRASAIEQFLSLRPPA